MAVTIRRLGRLIAEAAPEIRENWERELSRDEVCRSALASYRTLWEALLEALTSAEGGAQLPKAEALEAVVATACNQGMTVGQLMRGVQLWRDAVVQTAPRLSGGGEAEGQEVRACAEAVADHLILAGERVRERSRGAVERICTELAENAHDMIFAVDAEGKFVFVNPQMRLALGYRADELLGQHFTRVLARESREMAAENFERALQGQPSRSTYELEYLARNGTRIPVELNIITRRVGEEIVGRIGIARDVTVRKSIQLELMQRNRELAAMNTIIAKVGQSLHLEQVLGEVLTSCLQTLGADGGAICLFTPGRGKLECAARSGTQSCDPEGGEGTCVAQERVCMEVVRTGRYVALAPHLTWDGGGAQEFLEELGASSFVVMPLRSESRIHGVLCAQTARGNPHMLTSQALQWLETVGRHIGVAVDNARLYAEARRMAATDSATGLPNHGEFYRLLKIELDRSRRYRRQFCVAMIDLDELKAINDTYGHLTGDEALRCTGMRLRSHTRKADVVARYGGDEFALVLPETTADQAVHLARRIKRAVESFGDWSLPQARDLRLRLSIGIAPFVGQETNEDELIDLADKACYQAKRTGDGVTALAV